MPTRVLMSGFEPIWGLRKSPSGEICKVWQENTITIPNTEVHAVVLPQTFSECGKILISKIISIKPNYVVMFGSTPEPGQIQVERFAINIENSMMGDNLKVPVLNRKISINGPAAYESTLPCEKLCDAMNLANIPARMDYHAGTHVCNSLFYQIMEFIQSKSLPIRAGFIHVPFPNDFGIIESDSSIPFSSLIKASMIICEHFAASHSM